MVTIDKTTGAVTVDGTVTEEQKVAEVTLSVELNGQTGKATADIVQEATEEVATSYKLVPITDANGEYTESYLVQYPDNIPIKDGTVFPNSELMFYQHYNDSELELPKGYLIGYNDKDEEVSKTIVSVESNATPDKYDDLISEPEVYTWYANETTIQRSIHFSIVLRYEYDKSNISNFIYSEPFDYYIYQAGTEIRTDPDPENGDFYYIQTFDGEKPIQAGFDSYTGEQDEYGVLCSVNNPFERHIEKDLLKHYGLYGTLFAEDGSDQDILDTYYKGILYYRFTYKANSSSEVTVLDEGVIDEYIASTQYIWTPSEVHETGTYRLTCSTKEINNEDPDEGEPEPEPED